MRMSGSIGALSLLLAACDGGADEAAQGNQGEAVAAANAASSGNGRSAAPAAKAGSTAARAQWDLQSSGEGTALALAEPSGGTAIRLFCPAGQRRLLVNVSGFRPIGSEERLSFGSGGEAAALVADTRGDRRRGGVTGAGAVPDDLAALVRGPISASYGAQSSGPHPAPPEALARAFAAACREGAAAAGPPAAAAAHPCRMQDGRAVALAPLRAVGTEPFWGARIDGRCVTYSHPEDQKGSRIWTCFTPAPGGGRWLGTLGGKRVELTIRPEAGCSDGMSDTRYPLRADLLLGGERRSGCAEPLGRP